jgi:FkbM family methyltransferase
MTITKKLKSAVPQWSMWCFRKVRVLYRFIFRKITNRRKRSQYVKLITQRYPDISGWQDKGYVLDLGANLGHFTDAVSYLGFKVISVEPHPEAFKYLQRRFSRDPRVTLVNKAVSNTETPICLQLHPDHKKDPQVTSLSASTISEKFSQVHDYVEVDTVTFSQLIALADTFSIVKIDIEGAEIYLFEEIMSRKGSIENLLLETHSRFMLLTSYRDDYRKGLNLLHGFIARNNLKKHWYTDWV